MASRFPSKRQKIQDGYGKPYHRVYSLVLPVSITIVRKAMRELQKDLNKFSPQMIARFEKVKGRPEILETGDEFQIHITGPWNGPVRVARCSDCEFKLQTLEGHPEAGEIQFSVESVGKNRSLFQIESMARSRDAIVDLLYDKIPIAKLAQTEMWISFCNSFAKSVFETAGNREYELPDVKIVTECQDEETGQWQTM